ncbi:MAG TPA: hypothetical protein VF183_07875, partial [Acidimicrobiales bacterium]
YQRIGAQSRSYASGVEQDPMSIDGPFPVVTPDACIELCRRVRERGNHLLFKPLIGGLDPELGWSSLQLFVDKVLPSVRP